MSAGAPQQHERLYRLPAEGWLGGVCAGLADRLGIDPTAFRIVILILIVGSGGLAIIAYLVAWAVMPAAWPEEATDDGRGSGREETAGSWSWRRARSGLPGVEGGIRRPRNGAIRLGLGVTLLTLGILLAFRELGLWWSDAVVWPIVLAAGGTALVLRQIRVSGGRFEASRGRIRAMLRLYRGGFGVTLILAAAILFLYANGVFGQAGDAALAVLAIAGAAGLILAPFLAATARRARDERRQRIRSEERAEVAAHLHDSVLQTLAMIQRRSGDSAEIATLARRQERELREWLSGRGGEERSASLAAALERAAAEVEEAHRVPVEMVTVGDLPLDRRGEALLAATREAITNATRFAAVTVSVFAELSPERATVFVRDRGPGFDLDSVPPDRRGVRESIVGRMERHGGSATVRSRADEGTEIELSMEFS